MTEDSIPADVRRFILTSIVSVPYLEALLLLRSEPQQKWNVTHVAQRLYVSERTADHLLSGLHAAGFIMITDEALRIYTYEPVTPELKQIINRLAAIYSSCLLEVTHLIHSNTATKAQQFADAFKWRKDA